MSRPVRLLILTTDILTGKPCSIRPAWECPAQPKVACKFGIKLGKAGYFFFQGAEELNSVNVIKFNKISFGLFLSKMFQLEALVRFVKVLIKNPKPPP